MNYFIMGVTRRYNPLSRTMPIMIVIIARGKKGARNTGEEPRLCCIIPRPGKVKYGFEYDDPSPRPALTAIAAFSE